MIIGLVMLLLLTIIMLAAMRVTSLEEKMAGNLRNQNIAFQAAESALREGETRIRFFGYTLDSCLKACAGEAAEQCSVDSMAECPAACTPECKTIKDQDLDGQAATIDWDNDGTQDDVNPFLWLYRDGSFLNAKAELGGPEDSTCSFGLCDPTLLGPDDVAGLVDVENAMLEADTNIDEISAEPKYIIQLLNQTDSPDSSRLYATFLITAVAWGGDDDKSRVQLQSTFRLHSLHKVD